MVRIKPLSSILGHPAALVEGQKAVYRTGMALAEIRDFRLYREGFETFEGYCKDRWDMSKMHAYRLIGSSEVNDALKSNQIGCSPRQ